MYLRSILLGLPSFWAGRSYWYLKYNVCFSVGVCVFFVIILEKGLYGKGWCLFLPCSFRVCFLSGIIGVIPFLCKIFNWCGVMVSCICTYHIGVLFYVFYCFFYYFLVVHHGLWGFCVMLTAHISFVVVSTADCMLYDVWLCPSLFCIQRASIIINRYCILFRHC